MPEYEKKTVYIGGSRGSLAALDIVEYDNGLLLASGEAGQVTLARIKNWVRAVYGPHIEVHQHDAGPGYVGVWVQLTPVPQEERDA